MCAVPSIALTGAVFTPPFTQGLSPLVASSLGIHTAVMDEFERRSQEEKAQREAANVEGHERAHKHAAPLWGFGAAPAGGALGGLILDLASPDCYAKYGGGRHSVPKTDV